MADPDFQVKVVRWDGNCVGTVVPTKKQFEMFYLPLLGLPDSLVVSYRFVHKHWWQAFDRMRDMFLIAENNGAQLLRWKFAERPVCFKAWKSLHGLGCQSQI